MGGSGGQSGAESRAIQRANAARQAELSRKALANEKSTRTFEYEGGMERSMQEAELEAAAGVTSKRTAAIKESSLLLTDFQKQEKARLVAAKTGTGQVTAEHTAITSEQVGDANTLLGRDTEYWDNMRGSARAEAAAKAKAAYLEEHGSLRGYVAKGELSAAAIQNGVNYQGSGK